MTDDQLNELMKLAADGDSEAQQLIDSWIAKALARLSATPPLPDDVDWLNDEPECCCLCTGEGQLAA